MTPTDLPLRGVRVLDLSRVLAGPVCTQLLADLGGDVVKVERPGGGDDTRHWGPPFIEPGQSAYFLACNRGKRSLALDLGHPDSTVVLDGLVRAADVLLENFLPGTLAKLHLEPERLRQLNPRLVIASISAFGRENPWSDVPGYDLMIQAAFGFMAITGEPQGTPMKLGVAISDVLTGLYAASSVLAGLHARGNTGAGMHFDLALADCTLASLVNVAQSCLLTGRRPERLGNAHPQIVPYQALATSDGYLALAIGADRQWQRFCRAVGQPQWATDVRFATNPARVEHRSELIPLVADVLRRRSTADWRQLLTSIDVPHSPIHSVDEALASPQAAARHMVWPVTDSRGHEYSLVGSAVHWRNQPAPQPVAPPYLGEHSEEVLRDWLAYQPDRIAELRAAGAIA
jgi:crotonobetainyl-CoA:carnitine CoA-transferase CaiB-like acyl-CoA transferase